MKKKITTIILILILISNITVANAGFLTGPDSDLWGKAKEWIELGKSSQGDFDNPKWNSFNDLIGILWGAGIFIIAIVGAVIGIKYMFLSVEEKANIKESIWPFAIGSVIILGALTIWKILIEILASV